MTMFDHKSMPMHAILLILAGLAVAAVSHLPNLVDAPYRDPTQHASLSTNASIDQTIRTAATQTDDDPLIPPIELPGLVATQTDDGHASAWVLPKWGTTQLGPRWPIDLGRFEHDRRAIFHAHGEQVCASGCAASRHPTKELSSQLFRKLLSEYSQGPLTEDNLALEALLYYGPQTLQYLDASARATLDTSYDRFLVRELQRTKTVISIRVIDESGIVRSWIDEAQVPLDRRHVFAMETRRIQPLVTSGTVKRVGLDYLWTRL